MLQFSSTCALWKESKHQALPLSIFKNHLNCLYHLSKWLMTVISYTAPFECVHVCVILCALCLCMCLYVSVCVAAGSLLWFPCSGMCEDLAGQAPRHLLNIRGNNSWVDLKHGHPLHLTVSLRITPAASHSRWQVPVHRPAASWGLPISPAPSPPNNPTESLPSFSFCLRLPPAVHGNKVGGTQWFHHDNIPPCLISHNVSACCWNKCWLHSGCPSTALLWLSPLKDWERERKRSAMQADVEVTPLQIFQTPVVSQSPCTVKARRSTCKNTDSGQ